MRAQYFFHAILFLTVLAVNAHADVSYDLSVTNASGVPGGSVTIQILMNSDENVDSIAFSVCSDSAVIEVAEQDYFSNYFCIYPGAALAILNYHPIFQAPTGPDQFLAIVSPDGFAISVLTTFSPWGDALPPGNNLEIVTVEYQLIGGNIGDNTTIAICNDAGTSPPTYARVSCCNHDCCYYNIAPASTTNGTVSITPHRILRGDANQDGAINIADGLRMLAYLFESYPAACPEALDFNDDLTVNIGDPIKLYSYLFLDAPPPPAPFPDCETASEKCNASSPCP